MVRFLSWERTLSYLILITYLLGSRSFVMDRALFFLTFITEGRAGRHSPPASSLRTASIYLLKRFPFNNSAGETHAINHHHHHHHHSTPLALFIVFVPIHHHHLPSRVHITILYTPALVKIKPAHFISLISL